MQKLHDDAVHKPTLGVELKIALHSEIQSFLGKLPAQLAGGLDGVVSRRLRPATDADFWFGFLAGAPCAGPAPISA